MSKMIEVKQGNKTIYKIVPDDYIEKEKEIPQRELTLGGATVFSFGITKEQHEKIFKKEKCLTNKK